MCKKCQTNPVYEFTNKRKLCKNCFIKYFQKKVLYTIRKFNMIKKNDILLYKKTKDFRSIVLENILKLLEKKFVKVITKGKKYTKKVDSSTLTLNSHLMTKLLIKKDTFSFQELMPISSKIIKPLYLFLDEEVLLYAKFKKLKFKKQEIKKDNIEVFIETLKKKHPEIQRAIVNSYLKINNSI